jgi:hypothetical protein
MLDQGGADQVLVQLLVLECGKDGRSGPDRFDEKAHKAGLGSAGDLGLTY